MMTVGVELNRDSISIDRIAIPKEFHANLLWFDRLTAFDYALYLEHKADA